MTINTSVSYTIPLSAITDIDTGNIRTEFDSDSIKQLAASIKANGLLSPLIVRTGDNGERLLVAGHRRYRALQRLVASGDLKPDEPITCYVNDGNLADATVTMLVENLQREDISPADEARGYLRLVSEFGYKPKDLATAVGQSVAHINGRLTLVTLPDDLQVCLGRTIPIETGLKIARVEDEKVRKSLAKQAVKGTLSSWATDHALRDQDEAKDQQKITTWAERNMLTLHQSRADSPATDFEVWTVDRTLQVTDLAKAEIKKGEVLCLTYRGTSVSVYRKFTKAELADAQAKIEARKAAANANTDDDDLPYSEWYDRMDAHDVKVTEYQQEFGKLLVALVNVLPSKTLGKIVMEQQADMVFNGRTISYANPYSLCAVLDLDTTDRRPQDVMREYATTTDRALRVNVLGNYFGHSFGSPTLTEALAAEVERVGLVDPGSFDEPEPWQDSDGVWHINEAMPEDEADEADEAEIDDENIDIEMADVNEDAA